MHIFIVNFFTRYFYGNFVHAFFRINSRLSLETACAKNGLYTFLKFLKAQWWPPVGRSRNGSRDSRLFSVWVPKNLFFYSISSWNFLKKFHHFWRLFFILETQILARRYSISNGKVWAGRYSLIRLGNSIWYELFKTTRNAHRLERRQLGLGSLLSGKNGMWRNLGKNLPTTGWWNF